MADKKISQLTAASNIDGSELLAVVKNVNGVNQTLKTSVSDISGYVNGSAIFPLNPNEGDTFININNDYYVYNNSAWEFLPYVKIVAVKEAHLYIDYQMIDSAPFNSFNSYCSSSLLTDIDARMVFSMFDIYTYEGASQTLAVSNGTYATSVDLLTAIHTACKGNGTTMYQYGAKIVVKEKIDTSNVPKTSYSNGLYSLIRGRKRLSIATLGVNNAGLGAQFTNYNGLNFYNMNLGRTLFNYFFNLDSEIITNDIIGYTNSLRTMYNQLPIGTKIQNKGIYAYDYLNNELVSTVGYTLEVVRNPVLISARKGSRTLLIEEYGGERSGYGVLDSNEFNALIYPCVFNNGDVHLFNFIVKPLGVDQCKVTIPNGEHNLEDIVMLSCTFGNNKNKQYVIPDIVSTGDNYYKRFKIFRNIGFMRKNNIDSNTHTSIKVFTCNTKYKTRSEYSDSYVKLKSHCINNSGSFIPVRR